MNSSEITVLYEDRCMRLACTGHLFLCIWTGPPAMDQLRSFSQASDRHHAMLNGGKQVMANVIAEGAPNFTDEIRAETAQMTKRASEYRLANAHIILVRGLLGATIRSFMSTVTLLGRSKVPTKVFDNMTPGANWLLPYLSTTGDWSEERFHNAYEELRSRKV